MLSVSRSGKPLFEAKLLSLCILWNFLPTNFSKKSPSGPQLSAAMDLVVFIVFWQTKLIESMADASHSPKDRSSHQRCSIKKVFLEISQNSQENTCSRVSFFNKVAGLRQTLLDDCLLKDPFLAFFTQFNSLRCCQSRALHLFTQTRF